MTATIPTGEPTSLIRGDSAKWYVADTEYPPADGWTMAYYLFSQEGVLATLSVVTDNGDGNYLVTVSTAASAALAVGRHNWQRVATKAAERITRDSGDITITLGYADASGQPFVDNRSWAQQALVQIEAAILTQSKSGQTSASYNGRSVSWSSLAELYQLRTDLKAEVAGQDAAESAGLGRQIRIRYGVA